MDKDIRIVEIPTCKAVYSGLLDTEEKFEKFYKWVHSHEQDIFPRDFMRFNEKTGFNCLMLKAILMNRFCLRVEPLLWQLV